MSNPCVYFLKNESWKNMIKIGKTTDLKRRLRQHQQGGSSYPHYWEVARVIMCKKSHYSELEKLALWKFKSNRTNKKEFFEVSLEEVDEFLEKHIAPHSGYKVCHSLEEYLFGSGASKFKTGRDKKKKKKTIQKQNKPAQKGGRPFGSGGVKSSLTDEEIKQLYDSVTGKHALRNKAIITCGLCFGMRADSVAKLTVGQILDENNKCKNLILVSSNKLKQTQKIDGHFTSAEGREIINKYAFDVLRAGNFLENRDNPFFITQKSNRSGELNFIHPRYLTGLVPELFEKAGLYGHSWTSLRKTFAYRLAKEGLGLEQICIAMQLNSSSSIEGELSEILKLNDKKLIEDKIEGLTFTNFFQKTLDVH